MKGQWLPYAFLSVLLGFLVFGVSFYLKETTLEARRFESDSREKDELIRDLLNRRNTLSLEEEKALLSSFEKDFESEKPQIQQVIFYEKVYLIGYFSPESQTLKGVIRVGDTWLEVPVTLEKKP